MKVSIIGHFGGEELFTDGQTVKTKMLKKGLEDNGIIDIVCADTYYIKTNPMLFVRQFHQAMKNNTIFVLLSERGRKYIFPILWRKASKKNIYHYLIGGRLAIDVNGNPKLQKILNSFKVNWVESRLLVKQLVEKGIVNAAYLPNFKCIEPLSENEIHYNSCEPYRFCTFSRVIPEKGIEDAVNAVRSVNEKIGRKIAVLDIYGSVDENYKERFDYVLKYTGGGYSRYCGVVDPYESVNTLKQYYMMLFPTYWPGEGMPGSVIDAFFSGLPIIARRWKYCDEMIDNGYTGLIYDFDLPKKLGDMIEYAVLHKELVFRMKNNCLIKANEYSEKAVMKQIINAIEKD